MDRLKQYREKRHFRRTPEPAGQLPKETDATVGGRFVLHKHAAQRLHFDLRLEQHGVLRSWALPKGPALAPGEKRLAVEVEDHPLEYGDFEGVIPKREYGGGTVMIWDEGRWSARGDGVRDGRLDFMLEGRKLQGTWTLVRMGGELPKRQMKWLLIKRADADSVTTPPSAKLNERSVVTDRTMDQIAHAGRFEAERPGERSPAPPALPDPSILNGAVTDSLPQALRPQLATLTRSVPKGSGWIHEIKFDGYRLMAQLDKGTVRLISRNGKNWTERFPLLTASLRQQLPNTQAVLDGEVVALARDGSSSFRRLQEALTAGHTDRLVYQVFDLLYLDTLNLRQVALLERKRTLAQLFAAAGFENGHRVRYTDHIEAQGPTFFDRACRLGLEGIISKRGSSHYENGRTKQWLKVKCTRRQAEFVVGGYTTPSGQRKYFGSLLLGAYQNGDKLVYTGRVGTGFSTRELATLQRVLRSLERPNSPFHAAVPTTRGIHWVQPQLVVDIEYSERTRDGRLRQPSYRGVREDRDPIEIRLVQNERGEGPTTPAPRPRQSTSRTRAAAGGAEVAGIRLSHPQRVLYPEQGATKLALARYYERIQDWILPYLAGRPLSLLRCPQGRGKQCFFQKHPGQAIAADIPKLSIEEKQGAATYLYVRSVPDLVALVQVGVLEFHPWGARVDDIERPDIIVFDLDPAPDVGWPEIRRVASELRDRLEALGLASFCRTTGGKGLHLAVPLLPKADWAEVKAFARAVAQRQARDDPRRLTVNPSRDKRRGRIFIDYLRNSRGATAIASYSTRARAGAPVAVPIGWHELGSVLRADRYTVDNLHRRLAALRKDPWEDFEALRRPLSHQVRRAVGLD